MAGSTDFLPIEFDESFESIEAWRLWTSHRASVIDARSCDLIGARLLTNGFREPFTERLVKAESTDDKNWREGLMANGLNSRQRAVLLLIEEISKQYNKYDIRIFAAEAVTNFALFLRGRFTKFLGSEYAVDAAAAQLLFPIQHQDLTKLSLPSDTFDVVTTNEVLEHVPDLDAALHELARVLRPGGWHIGTVPFYSETLRGDLRSKLVNGALTYLKPPEYHGNPVDNEGGSLVFEIPGWDIIERARAAGFCNPAMRFVASEKYGVLSQNMGVFVLCLQK